MGVFSTMGGYHEYCGGISLATCGYRGYHDKCGGYLEYCGDVQYCGGYHEYCGGYLEYHGMFSTVGDIMMHVEDIMSTVGGGGGSVLWGILSFEI